MSHYIVPSNFASSSRSHLHYLTRFYATRVTSNESSSNTDSRLEIIRRSLYPTDSYDPKSSSPTGAYHPQHYQRVSSVIHSPEVYETIERAFKLFQRRNRESKRLELISKYNAMESACDELDQITRIPNGNEQGEGEGGMYDRMVYDKAMLRPNPYKLERMIGRRATPESRWKEARLDGLIPREIWIPTETRGKGWDYDWKRPSGERTVGVLRKH